jgi:CHASE2 domain-containing sensor protein
MALVRKRGKNSSPIVRWLTMVLVGEPFWSLWGGRILNTLIMSALVGTCLQLFDNQVRQFVDTTVQSTLLNQMSAEDLKVPQCNPDSPEGLANCITVVAVDDKDFRESFGQQSPLDPNKLKLLFDKMRLYPPRAVAVDLDLSPASAIDLAARDQLRSSILELSKATHVVMVCPQGYSTPEPGEFDRYWTSGFKGPGQFALPDLDADGLYYHVTSAVEGRESTWQMHTLGVATAAALRGVPVSLQSSGLPQGPDWNTACQAAGQEHKSKPESQERRLIRPSPVNAISFSQALVSPQILQDRVVVLGGKWGVSDTFTLRGQPDHFYGVNLHAWVLAYELAPLPGVPEPVELLIDVLVGMLCGIAFHYIWKKISHHKEHYAARSFFYMGFFAVAIGAPLLLVLGAVHLAKYGLTLGVAGMILSSAADSFTSAHENHEDSRTARDVRSRISVPVWIGLCSFSTLATCGAWIAGWRELSFVTLGSTLGLVFAWSDSKDRYFYTSLNQFHQEKNVDLLVRFLWLCAKLTLLLLALMEQQTVTVLMQFAFIGTWLISLLVGRQKDLVIHQEPPPCSSSAKISEIPQNH